MAQITGTWAASHGAPLCDERAASTYAAEPAPASDDGVLAPRTGETCRRDVSLVADPNVRVISFTGSSDTGAHISEIAGRLLKRVSAELGGKNAIIVLDDADVDLALDGIVWSAFGTSGQRCTAASRVRSTTRSALAVSAPIVAFT